MKVLLVFELVPEETHYYIFDNLKQDDVKNLCDAHGCIGNSTDLTEQGAEAVDWLSDFLAEREDCRVTADEHEPFEGPFDMVVTSGFML